MSWEPKKLAYSHEALARLIMANPTASNGELAEHFGRTPQWISMVKSSGLFRERYAVLAKEVMDPVLAATIEENLEMLTQRSLEVLNEKMARPSKDISDDFAIQAASFAAKGMGVGGFSTRPAAPQAVIPANRIEALAMRLTRLNNPHAQPQEIEDAQVIDR